MQGCCFLVVSSMIQCVKEGDSLGITLQNLLGKRCVGAEKSNNIVVKPIIGEWPIADPPAFFTETGPNLGESIRLNEGLKKLKLT